MTRRGTLAIALLLAASATGTARGAEFAPPSPDGGTPVEVVFRVNDAFVKDRMLPGVAIVLARVAGGEPVAAATTDAAGSARLRLAPGVYLASYELTGYVPITAAETAITGDGQVVTTTLSMLLETEGRPPGERRVRVVLNWGSDERHHVRDADSHLACACGGSEHHVYFGAKEHLGDGHAVRLDVDDMDWGGPETITLSDPPPGEHLYWVHDFSDGPGGLAASQVVVRVLVGDAVVDEFRPPAKAPERNWRPFRALRVHPDFDVEIVPFTAAELAQGDASTLPPGLEAGQGTGGCGLLFWTPAIVAALVIFGFVRRARRRAGRRRKLPR